MKEKVSNIKERLKLICSLKKITQKELAAKANVRESSISNYVKGKSTPNHEIICKLADALDITTDWLLGYGKDSDIETIAFEKDFLQKYYKADKKIQTLVKDILDKKGV